ncbi:hypothetical protein HWV62_45709 [Athelia sp. TMB]|nr:hypothetical protein HWV62_45709 [Athelia sp. TMB]
MTTLPNWCRGRPRHLVLNVEINNEPEDRHTDVSLYPSNDGKHIVHETQAPPAKRRRLAPKHLEDEYATWMPGIVEGEGAEEEQGDEGPSVAHDVVANPEAAARNTKRYLSSEWTGQFWRKRALQDLGLVVQLGHPGTVCHHPDNPLEFVVADSHGIHQVNTRYCACELSLTTNKRRQLLNAGWYPATVTNPHTCATIRVLDEFHLQNLKGGINVQSFVAALARQTDATKVSPPPDVEKAVRRMFRQCSFLKRLKRSGCGHDPAGVKATKAGEMAVLCWACPHDGINLPSGWRDVDKRFLYALILAMDANFRLVNWLIKGAHDDPALGPGWGHLVDDITTCIAFMALLQKDSKVTTGLRTSGVGACMCARHEVIRPCGVGDLQKGEQYANMDYFFFSAILGVTLLHIMISYDIVCQWKVHLPAQSLLLLENLRQTSSDLPDLRERLSFGIPVWHAGAHKDKCQVANSLRYQPGAGHTDGEGIEHGWSRVNPHASSTKEMGAGAHQDALDDIFAHHNFERNIGSGDMLSRKLVIAKEERDVQIKHFREIRDTVLKESAEKWLEDVLAWEEDRSRPNPYELLTGGMTQAAMRLQLQKEEMAEINKGQVVMHATSATGFLTAGLHIEALQRQIAIDASVGTTKLTANQASLLEEHRLQVFHQLQSFWTVQQVYMPHSRNLIQAKDNKRERLGLPFPVAEDIKLWLPSDLSIAARENGCRAGLANMELKLLRRGAQRDQVEPAFEKHLINRRNKNDTGQYKTTRSCTLIGRVGDRVNAQPKKYIWVRDALFKLDGLEQHGRKFKELLPEHTTLDEEELQPDYISTQCMNRACNACGVSSLASAELPLLGPSISFSALRHSTRHRPPPGDPPVGAHSRHSAGGGGPRSSKKVPAKEVPSESRKLTSWIWMAGDTISGTDNKELHASVQREYLKARARKYRWTEEVSLLSEEMRRVLCYLHWREIWWKCREVQWDGLDAEVADGLRAYALRQASICKATAARFEDMWGQSDKAAATNVLEGLEDTILQ